MANSLPKVILTHGECLAEMAEIPDNYIDMVLTDIPYAEVNQKSAGLRLLNRGNANECAIPLDRLVAEMVRVCSGSFYVFCGTQQVSPIIQHFKAAGLTTRLGAWEKTNPSPMNGSRLWLSGLEFCVFARKANATFTEHCKKALWQAPSGRAKIHPTEKPVRLMERLVLASSQPGAVVLDNCMGSGTTGVACVNTGRSFIGIEQDAAYFKIASERIAAAQKAWESSI
jgi:site-specific DNA-methyltransferase (adenine-specific)